MSDHLQPEDTGQFLAAAGPRPIEVGSKRPAHAPGKTDHPSGKGPRRARRMSPGKVAGITMAILLGVTVVAYAGGVVAFSNIFYPNTQIAGVDVSLMTSKTATDRVEAAASGYTLTVSGRDFSWTYTPESSDVIADADGRVDAVISKNDPFRWPVRLIEALKGASSTVSGNEVDENVQLPSDFDEQAFDEQVTQAVDSYNQTRTGTFDTASAYSEDDGKFSYERAVANVKVDRDRVAQAAKSALAKLDTTVELTDEDFDKLSGEFTDDQVRAACDAANKLIGSDIKIDMEGNEAAVLDTKTLASFVTFDASLTPTLSADAVSAWANELASSLNTVGTTRTYTRADGKQITVDGGTFGWAVDTDALVSSVQQAAAAGSGQTVQVPVKTKGDVYTAAGERDWKAYVDVDLTEQHTRYYDENGNLAWEAGCITGKPYGGDDTPTGVWKVNAVSKDGVSTMLRGPKQPDGSYEWESPVDVWIPFIRNSYGLHDATWQRDASFSNPNAYKTVGSHGCVNLQLDKAKELRALLQGKEGTAVIVHW